MELYGGLPDIFVPRVYTELSTRKVRERKKTKRNRPTIYLACRHPSLTLPPTSFYILQVLTLEWVEGARLVNREQIRQYNADPARLVDTLVQCSLRQMLEVSERVD